VAKIAIEKVRKSRAAQEWLGEPIKAGWLASGTIRQDETGWGEAKLQIPLSGPKGSAMLVVTAGKGTEDWVFSSLELFPKNQPKKLDLVRGTVEDDPYGLSSGVHFQPALQPELLMPEPSTPPSWDGSSPFVVFTPVLSSNHTAKLLGAISMQRPSLRHDSPVNQFEVDLHSGMFILRQTDLFIADTMPLSLTRTYRTWDDGNRAFGVGGSHPFDICPFGSRNPYTYLDLYLEDGRPVHFDRISKGTGYADAVYEHRATASEFFKAKIQWNGRGWDLRLPDGSLYLFPESYYGKNYAHGAPIEMRDARGNRIQLKRDGQRNLATLISPTGRTINFKYDNANRIVEAADDRGRAVKYSYDSAGRLENVADVSGIQYQFTYDEDGLISIGDANGRELLRNEYDDGRVAKQVLADGRTYEFQYSTNDNNDVVQTVVTMPGGRKKGFVFKDDTPLSK